MSTLMYVSLECLCFQSNRLCRSTNSLCWNTTLSQVYLVREQRIYLKGRFRPGIFPLVWQLWHSIIQTFTLPSSVVDWMRTCATYKHLDILHPAPEAFHDSSCYILDRVWPTWSTYLNIRSMTLMICCPTGLHQSFWAVLRLLKKWTYNLYS